MAKQVSFPYVSDLPPRAQRELERNFLDLQLQITAGASSIFDAIIDGNLTASSPANHQYKNLTELALGETWGTNQHLMVGVRQGGPTAISEPASVSLAGRGSITLFGIGSPILTNSGVDPNILPWVWQQVSMNGSNTLVLQNLWLAPSADTAIAGGFFFASDCTFDTHITGTSTAGANIQNCTFRGALALSGSTQNTMFNCDTPGGITVSGSSQLLYSGGATGGLTVSSSGAQSVYADFSVGFLTMTNGSGTVVNLGNRGGTVNISSTSPVSVFGAWQAVTFSGTPSSPRHFSGSGTLIDFTGPGQITSGAFNTGNGALVLRGNVVQAEISIGSGVTSVNPVFRAIGLTNSEIRLNVIDSGAGAAWKAYSFDAASHNNVLVLTGAQAAGYTTPSTDAGTNNRVITEISDTFTGTFPLSTTLGGTGINAPTAHKLLVGNGTGAMSQVAVGTNGQLLLGQTTADPTWNTMSGDGTMSAAGALAIIQSPAREVAYTEFTAAVNFNGTTSGTATQIVTTGAITLVAGRIKIEFYCTDVVNGNAGQDAIIELFDGATSLGFLAVVGQAVGNDVPCYGIREGAVGAGSHTYTVKGWNTGGVANSTAQAGAGGAGARVPGFIKVTYI